jgi:hypothetical protein
VKISPHITIDTDLESLEGPCPEGYWRLVKLSINGAFSAGLISADEHTHYLGRLDRIVARQQRKAA